MGLRIVTARYVGGARPKRFCRVIVARDGSVSTYDAHVHAYREITND
jgi:hypothetical protein